MKYGLKENTIQALQGVFAKFPQVEKAILYGSRAMGNFRRGSDIDLVLVGGKLDLSLLYKIETALDELFLPYKIDLSVFHTLESPDILDHIHRVGIDFYESPGSEWRECNDKCEEE